MNKRNTIILIAFLIISTGLVFETFIKKRKIKHEERKLENQLINQLLVMEILFIVSLIFHLFKNKKE